MGQRATATEKRIARRATGPRTAAGPAPYGARAGKARASLNALKRSFATGASFKESMIALGEDPKAYDRLYRDLLSAYQPTDALQAKLVEDLAQLYWRLARLDRARQARYRQAMERLEMQRVRRKLEMNRETLDALPVEVVMTGLRRMKDSPVKFTQILSALELVRDRVERRDFSENLKEVFDMIYGRETTWQGERFFQLFDRFVRPERDGAAPDEAAYEELRGALQEEVRSVREEYDLFLREQVKISPADLDACFAPSGKDWRWILRQENALDRAIDRKVRILLAFKRNSKRGKSRRALPIPTKNAKNK